jgi:hypothetical protein
METKMLKKEWRNVNEWRATCGCGTQSRSKNLPTSFTGFLSCEWWLKDGMEQRLWAVAPS